MKNFLRPSADRNPEAREARIYNEVEVAIRYKKKSNNDTKAKSSCYGICR